MTIADAAMTLCLPTSHPEGVVQVLVEPGRAIDGAVTWSLQTLSAGPSRSSAAYEQHLLDTVGSSYDWSDELRFDKRSGRLSGLVLKTPEEGQVDPQIARSWLAAPRRVGLPRLDDRESGFHVDPLDLRVFTEDGNALVVTDAKLPVANEHSLCLAIDRSVDLLFHGGRYSGWILRTPLAHLSIDPGLPGPGVDEPRLHELLRAYLELVVEPNITRMSDEDPEMRAALESLRKRVGAVDAIQARSLERAIGGVLETFYV